MSDFHKEQEHKAFTMLFASANVEKEYIKRMEGKLPHVVIKDKDEARICSMLDSITTLTYHTQDLQQSAFQAVMMARTYEDVVAYQLGINNLKPSGLAVCPACLRKAILALEESLEVMKDIEVAAKAYAAKL